jgi:hypothetical protein
LRLQARSREEPALQAELHGELFPTSALRARGFDKLSLTGLKALRYIRSS